MGFFLTTFARARDVLLIHDADEILDKYFMVPEIESLGSLEYWDPDSKSDSGNKRYNQYAVVYYQIDRSYIRDTWGVRLGELVLDKISDDYERVTPPAYVFVTRYDNLPNVGCEVLQG